MNNGVGVVVGRFHTDDLTEGHAALFREVCDRHSKVVVLIGVHPKLTTKGNPLDYASRQRMIQAWVNKQKMGVKLDASFLYSPIRDNAKDDNWSKNVDQTIENLVGPFSKIVLYGSRDSFLPHYQGKFPTEHLSLQVDANVSASARREEIHNKVLTTPDERRGAIWAAGNQRHHVTPCVDIALWRQDLATGDIMILMGRKHLGGSGLLGFPGGHIDKTDASAEDAAVRELVEETCAEVSTRDLEYVCSRSIPDWRNVNGSSMWTTLYAVKMGPNEDSGRYMARDDLEAIEWASLYGTALDEVSPTHQRLFTELRTYFERMRGENE